MHRLAYADQAFSMRNPLRWHHAFGCTPCQTATRSAQVPLHFSSAAASIYHFFSNFAPDTIVGNVSHVAYARFARMLSDRPSCAMRHINHAR